MIILLDPVRNNSIELKGVSLNLNILFNTLSVVTIKVGQPSCKSRARLGRKLRTICICCASLVGSREPEIAASAPEAFAFLLGILGGTATL